MPRRDLILKAIYEAERLHRSADSRKKAESGEGRVDVFSLLASLEVPVLFRPLEKLLGAYIDAPDKGVLVTTRRPLSVQRFTAAHELGHVVLEHGTSLDDENVLSRALFVPGGRYDPREIQANAFASHVLNPPWLIASHMRRQGWNREDLAQPRTVYQLALRMGSSYSATCYALEQSGAIDRETRRKLLDVERRSIKQDLLAPHERETWYGDVWLVTDRDDGALLEGSRSDTLILQLVEHATAGYLWNLEGLAGTGLSVRADERSQMEDSAAVGTPVMRRVVAEAAAEAGASGHVRLRELRPWTPDDPLHSIEIQVHLTGPMAEGLLPAQQRALLEVA